METDLLLSIQICGDPAARTSRAKESCSPNQTSKIPSIPICKSAVARALRNAVGRKADMAAWVWTWPLHQTRRTLHCAYKRSHVLLSATAAGVNERRVELGCADVVIRSEVLLIVDIDEHRLPACSDRKMIEHRASVRDDLNYTIDGSPWEKRQRDSAGATRSPSALAD